MLQVFAVVLRRIPPIRRPPRSNPRHQRLPGTKPGECEPQIAARIETLSPNSAAANRPDLDLEAISDRSGPPLLPDHLRHRQNRHRGQFRHGIRHRIDRVTGLIRRDRQSDPSDQPLGSGQPIGTGNRLHSRKQHNRPKLRRQLPSQFGSIDLRTRATSSSGRSLSPISGNIENGRNIAHYGVNRTEHSRIPSPIIHTIRSDIDSSPRHTKRYRKSLGKTPEIRTIAHKKGIHHATKTPSTICNPLSTTQSKKSIEQTTQSSHAGLSGARAPLAHSRSRRRGILGGPGGIAVSRAGQVLTTARHNRFPPKTNLYNLYTPRPHHPTIRDIPHLSPQHLRDIPKTTTTPPQPPIPYSPYRRPNRRQFHKGEKK